MKTLEEKIAILNGWEEWRGAESEEYIYDLNKDEDYKKWESMYGDYTAERCKEKGQYWLGGGNYYANVINRSSTCSKEIIRIYGYLADYYMEDVDRAYLRTIYGNRYYWEVSSNRRKTERSQGFFDTEELCYQNMRDYAMDFITNNIAFDKTTKLEIDADKSLIQININGQIYSYETKIEGLE